MPLYEVALVARLQQASGAPQFSEVAGLRWTGLSWERQRASWGRIDVGAQVNKLTDEAKAQLLDLSASPSELWVYRAGVRVAAGPLVSYAIQGRSITLYAAGLPYYLTYMRRDTDYTATATDQAAIVAALIDAYQAQSYGHFGLDTTSLLPTTVFRDLTLRGREVPRLLDVFTQMGARDNGYELVVDPATRKVSLAIPRQGADKSASVFLDRRNVVSPDFAMGVAADSFATDIVATSSTADGTVLSATGSNATVRASFGRVVVPKSYQDVSVQTTLNDHASRAATDLSMPTIAASSDLIPVDGAGVTDIDPGDVVTYSHDLGLGRQAFTPRLDTIRVTLANGREKLSVRFV